MKRVGLASVVAIALVAALLPSLAVAGAGRRGGGRRGGGGGGGGGQQGPPPMVFFVQLVEKGAKTGMTDLLVLRGDRFDSMACHQFGFGPGPLKQTPADKETTFSATTKSETQGTMNWNGTVKDNKVSGTIKWAPAKGAAKDYTFSGTRHERKGMLDGTKWKGEMTEAGGKPSPDTFAFAEGMFESQACHEYGFGRGPYMTTKKAGGTGFTAFTMSREQGTMQWDGTMQGNKISGTIMWYPRTGAAKKYTFSGTKQ